MQVQTMTLREALDQLSALTGKEWLRRDLESSGSGNVDIPYSGGMHVMIIDTRGLPSEYTTDWIFSVRAGYWNGLGKRNGKRSWLGKRNGNGILGMSMLWVHSTLLVTANDHKGTKAGPFRL